MTTNADSLISLGRRFHAALAARDWEQLNTLLTPDVIWTLPGENRISGRAEGAQAVLERGKLIASYGLNFQLNHVLVSRDNIALSLHNTATGGAAHLDEHLATVCHVRDGRIAAIETYLSDVTMMNAFFI